MWRALENAASACKPAGLIFIAIYNDQGEISRGWKGIKRLYNVLPRPGKFAIALGVGVYFEARRAVVRAMVQASRFQNPFATGIHKPERGMSWFRDVVDWAGGYPFEVARPEQIFDFYRARGFNLMRLKTVRGGHGCNEFVFRRDR
jgi:2-polyprenyl-6-hydroxyphenyl methylase/3-demethylubiquinone-9 3-methyltransferase